MIRNPLASLALIAALSSLPAAAQSARLFVFHGIPGLGTKVDVYANDGKLFTFDYGDIQGPLDVPPGNYKLEVKPEGQATVLLTATAGVVAGGNYSVIAHLKEDLNPTLSLFANDLSPLPAWKTRLAVRHTAGAGAVDLMLSRGFFPLARFKGLTNPNEILEELRAGRYQASLFAAGTRTRIAGPAQLTLLPGKFTQVFAGSTAAAFSGCSWSGRSSRSSAGRKCRAGHSSTAPPGNSWRCSTSGISRTCPPPKSSHRRNPARPTPRHLTGPFFLNLLSK